MDLLKKKWRARGNIKTEFRDGKLLIENNAGKHGFLVYPKLFRSNGEKEVTLCLEGKLLEGTGCTLKLLNRHRTIMGTCGLNSVFVNKFIWLKYFILVLYVPPYSKMELTKAEYLPQADENLLVDRYLHGDVLVATPGYPSLENKYNSAFVHTRVKAYQQLGWNVDVVYINDGLSLAYYDFDGVSVVKGDFYFFRTLLQKRTYKRILIHFFDDRFANVLESVDTTNSLLYFYLHGAETLYWDWETIASPYFGPRSVIDAGLRERFKRKDFFIKKYSQIKNAKWIFVTEWTRSRCEELVGLKFQNSDVIPCLIDTQTFRYEKKDPEQRKKIFVLRKFDDIGSYSLDTVVRIILELRHRPIFRELEFDIYGDGSLHEQILAPLRGLENVHIFKKFLTHEEIREVHRTHGIALFPTRYDSQAVSSCEAASSGCAVVTSDIPGVRQFIPADLGVMCQTENYREYADVIERMYNDPAYFLEVARRESESVQGKFDYAHTIQREIDMFAAEEHRPYFDFGEIAAEPTLTVVVPSYNVEKYLNNTVISMLDQRNANKLEILIVNDGSKDRTAEIGRTLEKLSTVNGRSIVRLIDKENGGHGSTINVGIREARGKYLKVVDGDDTVDSEEFAKLIDLLEKEDSDVVLNNYIEDFAHSNIANPMRIYTLLKPGIQYHFEDICYPNYGFTSWGPILSCSSYKTSVLRDAGFKLSEKMFYVDMELNINVAICCDTITYYDLNIYRYLLGRAGQSVSRESYRRNYKHHENVCISMAETYARCKDSLPESKRNYIVNNLLLPMVSTQYEIALNYRQERQAFRSIDERLKKYPELYNARRVKIRKVVFHRKTGGIFVPINSLLVKLNPFRKH